MRYQKCQRANPFRYNGHGLNGGEAWRTENGPGTEHDQWRSQIGKGPGAVNKLGALNNVICIGKLKMNV